MKSLITLFFKRLHFIIFAYMCWILYDYYNEHSLKMTDLASEIEAAKMRVSITAKKLEQTKSFQRDLENGKNRLEEATELLKKMQAKLPNATDDTVILDTLVGIANNLNIKDIALNPLTEVNNEWYFSKRYELKIKATYLQCLVFFEQLGNNDRIFNIPKLKLERVKTTTRGRFQFIDLQSEIEVYRLNSDYDASADITKQFDELQSKGVKKP